MNTAKRPALEPSPYAGSGICETPAAVPKAWERRGPQNVPVTQDARDRLRDRKNLSDFEHTFCCPYDRGDLSDDVLAEFRKVFSPGATADFPDERLLYEAGALIRRDGEYWFTHAGLLFFGSNPQRVLPASYIRLLRFGVVSGDWARRGLPTFDRKFTGPVTKQIREARTFFRESAFFKRYQKRRETGGFVEEPEFPPTVIDEAIVNAVAHRDYRTAIPTECEAYTDAFVVKNPGRMTQRDADLPSRFSLAEVVLDSMPRNPKLLEWLKLMRDPGGVAYVQAISEGTKQMVTAMEALGLPAPSYRLASNETLIRIESRAREREAAILAANEEAVMSRPERTGFIFQPPATQHRSAGRRRRGGVWSGHREPEPWTDGPGSPGRRRPMSETLRPWLECVELHPDVLSDEFSEDVFALDLGALSDHLIGADAGLPAAKLPRVPAVYRDAASFFAASYLTGGLRALLDDVFGRLAGARGNRVLKLQTPFGGGKSHTLAALLHGARARTALDALPEAAGLPRPDGVRVAVVDGQFFDATTGKRAPAETFAARTVWGWIAWALGGRGGYEIVRAQDEARVAPGGDEIIALLRRGPSLILIDELLEYLVSAGGVRVERTTLRDETLSFLKRLTAAVGAVDDAVLVYSLQSSKRESLEYTGLLRTVEHLAARKDQRREPVEGNEILNVIQRRLLAATPDPRAAGGAAEAWRQVFTRMRRAWARSDAERRQAEEDGLALRDRITAAYPFHPALVDVMRERWAAVPEFQRTRGALRFLASCLRAAHRSGASRALLGPGDVPIRDADVRLAFFKEVGQREDFLACLEHDFVGANARARRIDDRRARETTAEAGRRPATRLATTMLLYSFGGLRRAGGGDGDPLPPGVGEADLLDVAIGPDLDGTTAQACLKELREQCLYLHFDGVRYCFKKDPNVTLLVEQEADAVARDDAGLRVRIRELIEERLAGRRAAVVWPAASGDVPDSEARFLIAYLPIEFAALSPAEQREKAREICERHGSRPREFRNGLGLAVPAADQVEVLRRAVRYLLAIERVRDRWREHNLTDAQKGQLREREATERAAAESALLKLYPEVWLPASADGALKLDVVGLGGRPLQTTLDEKKRARIHERLSELLTTVQRKVFGSVAPGRIVELYRLGAGGGDSGPAEKTADTPGRPGAGSEVDHREGRARTLGIPTGNVVAGFFSFLGFPRLDTGDAVRAAIARGVETGLFAYTTGRPALGDDGRYRLDRNRIAFQRTVSDDEIDLDSGFLIAPAALPEPETPAAAPIPAGGGRDDTRYAEPGGGASVLGDREKPPATATAAAAGSREITLSFSADRNELFNAWNALANLADATGRISVRVQAASETGFDEARIENGVLEPLRELGLIGDDHGERG